MWCSASCSEHLYERLKQSDPERATGRETIPLTNDELFTFHSVRAMLNEMVKSVEECDVLVWCGTIGAPSARVLAGLWLRSVLGGCCRGGDTRWLTALRIEGANQIPSGALLPSHFLHLVLASEVGLTSSVGWAVNGPVY